MKKKKNNITGLNELNNEIDSLRQRKDTVEKELDQNWDHLKNNFPSMLRHSLFKKTKTEFHSGWAQTLFSIPQVQDAVGNSLQKISVKLEEIILHWLDKFTEKKENE